MICCLCKEKTKTLKIKWYRLPKHSKGLSGILTEFLFKVKWSLMGCLISSPARLVQLPALCIFWNSHHGKICITSLKIVQHKRLQWQKTELNVLASRLVLAKQLKLGTTSVKCSSPYGMLVYMLQSDPRVNMTQTQKAFIILNIIMR